MLHVNHHGTVFVPPTSKMVPLSSALPAFTSDNQYVPSLQATDHIGQSSSMPPPSTIDVLTVHHVIKSNRKCWEMTGILNMTSSAKWHKVKIGSWNDCGNYYLFVQNSLALWDEMMALLTIFNLLEQRPLQYIALHCFSEEPQVTLVDFAIQDMHLPLLSRIWNLVAAALKYRMREFRNFICHKRKEAIK